MVPTLKSWKEIARYVGKGVRTVQRWEREIGLPVRRLGGDNKGIVLAFTHEIDEWINRQFTQIRHSTDCEVAELHDRLKQLLAENEMLRRRLTVARKR